MAKIQWVCACDSFSVRRIIQSDELLASLFGEYMGLYLLDGPTVCMAVGSMQRNHLQANTPFRVYL